MTGPSLSHALKREDQNDMAYWFPRIEAAGLPVPRTTLMTTEVELFSLLDGETPDGWKPFTMELYFAAAEIGGSHVFLRTGQGSGKHDWRDTCYLPNGSPTELVRHIGRLVEWSAMADMARFLPVTTWVVREMLPTFAICHCELYGGMPVVREFRYFVRDGAIEHVQPYWPHDAVAEGQPESTVDGWETRLQNISNLDPETHAKLWPLAVKACEAVGGGHWSVDFLQDAMGDWWLTDMALGDQSYKYGPDLLEERVHA